MSKPVLYMLNTWYDAPDQGPFYCPDCGIVEGFFFYNPKIKEQVDIIHVDFQRPRPEIIEQLGEENQGSPVLVLPDDSVSFARITALLGVVHPMCKDLSSSEDGREKAGIPLL